MPTYDKSVEVAVPVSVAFAQWTEPKLFPRFMSGVEHVTQVDADHLHWMTGFGGFQREFDVEITERRQDECIAWRTTGGAHHTGSVTFTALDERRTRVELHLDHRPSGALETIGSAAGVVGARLQGYLNGFRKYAEEEYADNA